MKVRALLVGTGGWAEKHLMAYQRCPNVEVAGIVGHSNRARVDKLGDAYGIQPRFMDVAQAIETVHPDVVDVAGSPRFRLPVVQACIGKGVKLVNLEKPMALGPDEAYAIEALCRQHGLRLTINHQKKFNQPWAKACGLVRSGRLGAIRFFRATCKGNMLEQGTHIVDMILHFNGYAPIASVMAQVADLQGFDKPKAAAPDSAAACVLFSNGVRAELALGNNGWDIRNETNKWFHFAVEAYGTAGHLIVTLNQTLTVTTYADGKTVEEPSSWDQTFLQGLADHLSAAGRYAADPATGHISNLDNSMKSFEAVMAIYASAAGEGRVDFPRRFSDTMIETLRRKQGGVQ
jgi:predicted dehydrogenase